MKTLRQLTNVEKAGILHSWFPEEIAPIVDAIQGMSESIIKNEAQEREIWTGRLLNFDFWLQLAKMQAVSWLSTEKSCTQTEGFLPTSSLMATKPFLPCIALLPMQRPGGWKTADSF